DQIEDVMRVEAAREDDSSVDHRRYVRRHRLAKHVAEWQQIQKANRVKRPRVLLVLLDLAIHGLDVREDVAMADDDAFGLGGRPRREDDLNDVVARDLRI